MNLIQLQLALIEIETQIDDLEKTNICIGDQKIIINNTGQDHSEPVRWELDGKRLIIITEKELI